MADDGKLPEWVPDHVPRGDYMALYLRYWAIRKAFDALSKRHERLKIDRGISQAPKRKRKRRDLGLA